MIHLVSSEHIDLDKWDRCLAQSSNSNFFGYSWYLNAICEHWDALVLNDYEAVFPLPNKRKFGFRVLYQPFFSRLFNIYSPHSIENETKQLFFDFMKKKFHRILLGYGSEGYFRPEKLRVKEMLFQSLDLSEPYEQISNKYSKNAKRMLKRANNYGLNIQAVTPNLVVDLFKRNKGGEIKELKSKDYWHLENLMTACLNENQGVSLGAYDTQGELCAAAFFIVGHHTMFYLKGGSNSVGRQEGAMYLLFDHMIAKYAGGPMMLDFGGSQIPSVAQFYKKFGGIDQSYYFVSKTFLI